LEAKVGEAVNRLAAGVLKAVLNAQLVAPEFIKALKDLGARLGMQLKGYRSVKVHLASGQAVEVVAPYFVKAVLKGRRRARCPGSYLGLEVLGFLRRCSPRLISEVAQAALLCPSFEVAHAVLKRRGLRLNVKTLRCLCRVLFEQGRWFRGKISLAGTEELAGQTLVIGIDGGRLRERHRKRSRRPFPTTKWRLVSGVLGLPQTVAGLALERCPRGTAPVIVRDVAGQEKGPGPQQMGQLFCS
jgi:hypothetical protein